MSPHDFKLPTLVGKVAKRLSKSLRIQRQTSAHGSPIGPSTLPTDSPSLLTVVPVDVVEEILLCLPGQDIVRMRQVR
jgi:hypothetical protein